YGANMLLCQRLSHEREWRPRDRLSSLALGHSGKVWPSNWTFAWPGYRWREHPCGPYWDSVGQGPRTSVGRGNLGASCQPGDSDLCRNHFEQAPCRVSLRASGGGRCHLWADDFGDGWRVSLPPLIPHDRLAFAGLSPERRSS